MSTKARFSAEIRAFITKIRATHQYMAGRVPRGTQKNPERHDGGLPLRPSLDGLKKLTHTKEYSEIHYNTKEYS